MRPHLRLSVLSFVCVAAMALGLALPGLAEAQVVAETQVSTQLTMPSDLDLEMAKRSMAGPITETVGGGLVIGASPILGIFAAVMAGAPIICLDEESDCETERRKGRAAGLTVGVLSAAVGVAMIGHGAYRIRQIRQARRHVWSVPTASLDLDRERAGLRLQWAF